MKQSDLIKILLAAIPFGLYFFVWVPLLTGAPSKISNYWAPSSNVASLNAAITGYERAITDTKNLVAAADALATEYAGVSSTTLERMDAMIPKTVTPIFFSDEMLNFLQENRIDSGQIVPKKDEKYEGFQKHTFNISGKARYQTIKQLVEALEKSKRLYFISGINLKADQGEYEVLFDYGVNVFMFTEE